jgi:hypothetical protein
MTGKSDTASFRAGPRRRQSADAFLFVERIGADSGQNGLAHPNGVTGIVEVVAVSDMPNEQRRLFSIAAGIEDGSGTAFDLSNATLTVLDPASFAARFGVPAGAPTELRFAGIVFSVRSANVIAELLAANSIEHDIRANGIFVARRPDGGAFISGRSRPGKPNSSVTVAMSSSAMARRSRSSRPVPVGSRHAFDMAGALKELAKAGIGLVYKKSYDKGKYLAWQDTRRRARCGCRSSTICEAFRCRSSRTFTPKSSARPSPRMSTFCDTGLFPVRPIC